MTPKMENELVSRSCTLAARGGVIGLELAIKHIGAARRGVPLPRELQRQHGMPAAGTLT
jgi:hypothetical protein